MIKTSQEIIAATAKELSIPEHKVQAVYDTIIKYIHILMRAPSVVAIRLPLIGILYAKLGYLVSKSKAATDASTRALYQAKQDAVRESISSEESNYNNRHIKKNKIDMKYFNKGMSIKEIEEFQNGEKN